MKLGHCVCNPKKPCPCDIFKEKNICTCAGERPEAKQTSAALTKYVRKAGCASKIGQADLKRILGNLPPVTDPNVLVGTAAGDDAGVYKLTGSISLVQTVDVFTPCVDDPYLFGRIAAANSVSDVYAMGGKPISALSVVGFPIDILDGAIMEDLLRGGMDTLDEANCSLIGGHSINDEEVKCGFAVTGVIESAKAVERGAAEAGDVLVLTKALGTGIICFGAQIGRISETVLNEAGESMATLNKDAAELMVEHNAHACTDVTGFGLMGHLVEMARGSSLAAEIDLEKIPVFAAVEICLDNDIIPGAVERNQEYSMAWAVTESDNSRHVQVLFDPQTSGGLLVALPESDAENYVKALQERGHSAATIIGRIVKPSDTLGEGKVMIRNSHIGNTFGTKEGAVLPKTEKTSKSVPAAQPAATVSISTVPESEDEPCCASPPFFDDDIPASSIDMFTGFMQAASAPGAVDAKTKKLMAIALSVAKKCRPCLVAHMKGALGMGMTREEIDEAAYLAISFAGCPTLMLYREVCKEIYG